MGGQVPGWSTALSVHQAPGAVQASQHSVVSRVCTKLCQGIRKEVTRRQDRPVRIGRPAFDGLDFPERAFEARTAAAICVLLLFLVLMNGLAVFLRKRFERRW